MDIYRVELSQLGPLSRG